MKKTMLLCLLAVLTLTACNNKNIHELVKQVAEAPVDTTGFAKKEVLVSDYCSAMLDCFADVTYTQTVADEQPRVVLMGPEEVLENMKVKVRDGELLVETDRRYRMPEGVVAVVHLYSPFVNSFMLNGGKCLRLGKVEISSPLCLELNGVGALTADSILCPETTLTLNGSGSADLRGLSLERLSVVLNGIGHIYLQGQSGNVTLEKNGTGVIYDEHLKRL